MQVAKQRFEKLGLKVVFAPNFHSDLFISTPESIQKRVDDISNDKEPHNVIILYLPCIQVLFK